jgi:hypothetical protein
MFIRPISPFKDLFKTNFRFEGGFKMADISAIKLNNTTYTLKDASSARTIDLSIDPTTYVLTATLKDASGNVISTSTRIDLPLETMVVGGEYVSDDPTYGNAIKLELNNGTYVTFPIGGLVSGLQSEITSNSKLSSDLVDDTNKTNRIVTAANLANINNLNTAAYRDVTDSATSGSTACITSGGVYTILGNINTVLEGVL